MEMGEVSHVKLGVSKPRPLGLVKKELAHFEDVDTVRSDVVLPETETKKGPEKNLYLYSRTNTEGDFRQELRSMRNLQETLRQAALLNIVAAVNCDDKTGEQSVPASRQAGQSCSQSVGIKGANLLRHTLISGPGKLVMVPGSSVIASSYSHNMSGTVTAVPTTPGTSLTDLLRQRSRTISIPRPRTHGESSFRHSSLLDAKEKLANLTNFRSNSRQENVGSGAPVAGSGTPSVTPGDEKEQVTPRQLLHTRPRLKTQQGSEELATSFYTLKGMGFDSDLPAPSKKADTTQNLNCGTSGTAAKLSKEEQRNQNMQQMQALKRHISTSKKKELVKRLTEIAKCEAVDISEPMGDGEENFIPPMIIQSQQKEFSHIDGESPEPQHSPSQRGKSRSITSLDRNDTVRVPSNTRVQSETHEAIVAYRESKGLNNFSVGEDLRIEGVSNGEAYMSNAYRPGREEHRYTEFIPSYPQNDMTAWVQEHFFSDGVVGRNVRSQESPDVLELRPLASSPSYSRNLATDRRRLAGGRRSLSQSLTRDKHLVSPSPVVFEATYHRPKACAGQISLVGQSLPALSQPKSLTPSPLALKPMSRRGTFEGQIPTFQPTQRNDENQMCERAPKPSTNVIKPWGSIAKQPSAASPILRTEIVDHLQCVGIVDRRPSFPSNRRSIAKVGVINKVPEDLRSDDEFDDDNDDDDMNRPPKANANYRKSKLYSAFRASEENLANLAEVSSLVSESMTTRSLLNQLPAPAQEKRPRDPVQQPHSKEPRYMGSSSRVSENETGSQFHYANDGDEAEAKKGASSSVDFRVFKALDSDVYFEFQHRKYRSSNVNTFNTAGNKPRTHFLKVKYSGEAKS